jgi:predicted nucleotide-binding protein
MEKTKRYAGIKFSSRIVRKVVQRCRSLSADKAESGGLFSVTIGDERWKFDDVEEFFTRYADDKVDGAELQVSWDKGIRLYLFMVFEHSSISINSGTRASIESIFSILEESPIEERIALRKKPAITIFMGHGRNQQWQKLKSHLQDQHNLEVQAYETGARAGHTIRDILGSMSKTSSLALLVLTGEDKSEDGMRARQNVIHECGLFQGRLGFDRAIMLVEKDVKLASNFDGIQQLRFAKGRISEVFGHVIATLRREFGPM